MPYHNNPGEEENISDIYELEKPKHAFTYCVSYGVNNSQYAINNRTKVLFRLEGKMEFKKSQQIKLLKKKATLDIVEVN